MWDNDKTVEENELNISAKRISSAFIICLLGLFLMSASLPAEISAAPAKEKRESQSKARTKAPSKKEKLKVTAPAVSMVRRLLQSAGRDPDSARQEKGFILQVPDFAYDGEAFLVRFDAPGVQSVLFNLGGKEVNIPAPATKSGLFEALLPVALDSKDVALPFSLTARRQNGNVEHFAAPLPLKKRRYPVQKLTVDSKFVSPPPEMEEKIKRDRAEIRAAVRAVSPVQYWTLPLARPLAGPLTSLYGSRRVFNGIPKSPHKGLDFDAEQGDPVKALDDGVVTLVSEHYYGGNTVLVDHGLGVVSAYLHLSAFNVRQGQKVTRGEVIAFVGSTGRVTGPHLHLSLYVLGESINADPCLEQTGPR
ncbi:MAG: M23 family metallopeptidase [Desulfovibrio sp.]|jgi:murein DD-endopeptidase MepM/ murein hydrolase activator NlpD|nr:M23 family metallopeptidase [Desulfovibrio sp.]